MLPPQRLILILLFLLSSGIYGTYGQNLSPSLAFDSLRAVLEKSQLAGDKKITATTSQAIANAYLREGNYPDALKYFLNALELFEKLNDLNGVASCQRTIGYIFTEQGNYKEALTNLNLSREHYRSLHDNKGWAKCELNIGYLYEKQNLFDEAVKHYTANLSIAAQSNDSIGMAGAYLQLGSVWKEMGKFEQALEMEKKALPIYEQAGRRLDVASAYGNIANIYIKQSKISEARSYLLRGLEIVRAKGSLLNLMVFYRDLSSLEESQQDFKLALFYSRQFNLLKDSLLNSEKSQEVSRLKMQYDFDKKDAYEKAMQQVKDEMKDKELQRQKVFRNSLIAGLAVVLIFSLVFFAQRNRIRREKKRSDELLLNILPATVADELQRNGVAHAQHFEQVTVMFADIKGFTSIAEKFTPAELVQVIDQLFGAFDLITARYGIEKIKTIGDCYMCASGLPIPNQTHAFDIVSAALEIQEYMKSFNAEKGTQGYPQFNLRIGIHSGPVVAGVVGSRKFAYDIWGDTVNMASRMEASGEPGEVNISSQTYTLIAGQFDCVQRGSMEVKGKGSTQMYFVRKKLDISSASSEF